MSSTTFTRPPPPTSFTKLSFPGPHILLVTLSRPRALNCINSAGHAELDAVWSWLDNEPVLRVGIVTGEGRAFCAGADLKEWDSSQTQTLSSAPPRPRPRPPLPPSGFGGLSRRRGKKPIIAAVNGLCLGGGCEMIINTDMILASPGAIFGLPEVKRGVVAIAGALPRLVRTVGKPRAMEMALTGRDVPAAEAERWGLVNAVCEGDVVDEAVRWAGMIAGGSPDSVVVSREGVRVGWECGAEEADRRVVEGRLWKGMEGGENMREGVRAFVEKRGPRWVGSKL